MQAADHSWRTTPSSATPAWPATRWAMPKPAEGRAPRGAKKNGSTELPRGRRRELPRGRASPAAVPTSSPRRTTGCGSGHRSGATATTATIVQSETAKLQMRRPASGSSWWAQRVGADRRTATRQGAGACGEGAARRADDFIQVSLPRHLVRALPPKCSKGARALWPAARACQASAPSSHPPQRTRTLVW
eukprot:7382014-Prymnesium_polylepis.3